MSLHAWGDQRDHGKMVPRTVRAFEPASFAAAESADVLMFLMSFENPSPEVIEAVESGVGWIYRAQLLGIKVERIDGDVFVMEDPTAPPLWARFYDLNTMQPV